MTVCSDASELDPLVPVDKDIIKGNIELLLGGSPSEISDTVYDTLIDNCISKYEDSQIYNCDITFCSLLSVLKYMIRKGWSEEGSSNGGVIKRQKDKEAGVEIEIEYAVSESTETGWDKLYEYFLQNPEDICECLKPENTSAFGLVKIGGTRTDDVVRVDSDSSINTVWDSRTVGNKYSYRREQSRRRSNNRSKYWSR